MRINYQKISAWQSPGSERNPENDCASYVNHILKSVKQFGNHIESRTQNCRKAYRDLLSESSQKKMSFALEINLWWDEWPDFFQKFAETILCLPIDSVTILKVISRDRNFDRQGLPREYPKTSAGPVKAIAGENLNRDQIESAIDNLRRFGLSKIWIEAETSFPIPTYDPESDSLQDKPILICITLNSPEWLKLTGYEEQGQIRISFHQAGRFRSPENQYPYLFNKMPSTKVSPQDLRRRLEIARQVQQNYKIVLKIAEDLIDKVDPDHLIVSDEYQPQKPFISYHPTSGLLEIADSL